MPEAYQPIDVHGRSMQGQRAGVRNNYTYVPLSAGKHQNMISSSHESGAFTQVSMSTKNLKKDSMVLEIQTAGSTLALEQPQIIANQTHFTTREAFSFEGQGTAQRGLASFADGSD